jgi:hypothetical protein
MSLNLKPLDSEEIVRPYDDWALKVFILSTIFIVLFAVDAINNWNPLIARSCILLACILIMHDHPPKDTLMVQHQKSS